LQHPDLPVINVGTRDDPTYLPAEVCEVLPGLVANKKLDPFQTQNMIKFAVRKPGQNATFIVNDGLRIAGLTAANPLLVCLIIVLAWCSIGTDESFTTSIGKIRS
jgi:eukaryotic translation initiation factor 2C